MARSTKREQILEALQWCFYEHGITSTGVDAVAAAAGVSKRTLYNHFPTKDHLVLNYVRWREARWRQRLDGALAETASPTDRILTYFDSYFDTPDGEDFRGCAFINAAAEIADESSPVLKAIVESKEQVRTDIENLLLEAGHPSAPDTATTVAAILEGGCAVAGMKRDRGDLDVLKRGALALMAAQALVDSQTAVQRPRWSGPSASRSSR